MLKKLIYHTLYICTFSNALMGMEIEKNDILTKQSAHPIKCLDKSPEDLFSLAKTFDAQVIEDYKEDLNKQAALKVENFNEQFAGYSLEKEYIPQIIQIVTAPALQASLKVLNLTSAEDTILYLGRSPAILHIIGSYLAPKMRRSSDQHIQLNYSGSANIPNSRGIEINDLRNVVTENRLSHFCQYLDEKGLSKLTSERNLYIVDQVGKGGGLNGFLRILTYYYTKYKNLKTTPNVTLLLMNFNDQDPHIENGYYMYNPKSTTFMFSGLNNQNKGFRSICVQAKGLGMPEEQGGALDVMDDEVVQQYILPARAYPPYCWAEKYDAYRDSTPELASQFTEMLLQACNKMISFK